MKMQRDCFEKKTSIITFSTLFSRKPAACAVSIIPPQ